MAAGKCKAAYHTDEWHGYGCEITEGACMFTYPDSKRCAAEYGEGPDSEYEESKDAEYEEPEIEKFTVHYANGTIKEFDKGFFCQMEKEDGEETLTFHMAHCAGDDLRYILLGCVRLAFEMGWIKDS